MPQSLYEVEIAIIFLTFNEYNFSYALKFPVVFISVEPDLEKNDSVLGCKKDDAHASFQTSNAYLMCVETHPILPGRS